MKRFIEWLHENSNILTEGMHWPEDYVKKAYNRIKSSSLGQASWYADEYVKTDINNIVQDFQPLSHDSKNLGYFLVIIRWFIEYSGTNINKYKEFLETSLSSIIKTLLIVSRNSSLSMKYKDKIKQMSFDEFLAIQDSIDNQAEKISIEQNNKEYVIVPINSYEQMFNLFGGSRTGAGIDGKGWCHTNYHNTYNTYITKQSEKFFVLASKDWKQCKPNLKNNDNAYDEYGLSLMAIKVKFNQPIALKNVTLRYNHVISPKTAAVDNAFNTFDELSDVVGFDVKAAIEKYQRENNINNSSNFELNSHGDIILDNDITSLEGAPQEVGGSFKCSNTKITSLEGAPQEVGGDFICAYTNITSLEGAPQEVGGSFICAYTNITSLEGAPQEVGGDFECNNTKITSLKGSPQEIGGDFVCDGTNITSLEGAPQEVGGDFICYNSANITSLEGAPQEVGGDFICYKSANITSLEGAPQKIGGTFYGVATRTPEKIDAYLDFLKHPTPEHIDETGHYKE